MKVSLLFLSLAVLVPALRAQRYDSNWLLGYDSKPGGNPPHYGVSQLHFTPDSLLISYVDDTPMSFFWTGGSMSDSAGNLLFYTNGCSVRKADHNLLENGTGLNPGDVADFWCGKNYGYPLMQGLLILPLPEYDGVYYIIHLASQKADFPLNHIANKLYYSRVDLNAAGGQGALTEKNEVLVEDTLCFGQLTAVRHGNGRDWWIVMPESSSDRYYKFLLNPDGITGPYEQRIGKMYEFRDWSGQAHFTPDGTKYLRFDTYNHLNIFDFDRCSGELSNHRFVKINFPADSIYSGGLAISPNSRFAYVSTEFYVYQLDLQSADIGASQTVVGTYDGFESPKGFAAQFYAAQLAPDGKIYLNCTNSVDYLHVIQYPDQPGLACGLVQHGVQLAGLNAYTMPHFPNYTLYDVPGSLCDTLGINGPLSSNTPETISDRLWRISPNPGNDVVTFAPSGEELQASGYWLILTDSAGKLVYQNRFPAAPFSIRVSGLVPGIYAYRLAGSGVPPAIGKIVVVR